MEIKKAEEKNFEQIANLHLYLISHLKSSNNKRYKNSNAEKERFLKKLNNYTKNHKILIIIAEEKDTTIGYAIGKINNYPKFIKYEKYGEIYEIVIDPNYQNKGIAKQLIKKLITFFQENNIKSLELTVDSNNTQAIKAWEHLGFKEQLKTMQKEIYKK
jgi:ribosomal protein S18 acetylase RimI-like enzyme